MKTIQTIVDEMVTVSKAVQEEEYLQLVQLFQQNSRFFFTGEGRSGFIMKAVAMRMMHAGKTVFVVGETITPSITQEDVLLVLSGSGTTPSSVYVAQQAKKSGATIFLITADADALKTAPFSKGLVIPAATKSHKHHTRTTIQPLGNQFDQAAHLILDASIIDATQETSYDSMKKNHANLE